MRFLRPGLFLALCLSMVLPLYSQEAEKTEKEDAGSLPNSFRGISLGMNLESLKEALKKDSIFNFRGDRDVSLLPNQDQSLVEISGLSYIKRAFFQLNKDSLFIMSLNLDSAKIDHYSVYTTLVKKYGEPKKLDPQEAVWENDTLRLSLERPLTVKYIEKAQFQDLLDKATAGESAELQRRGEFLSDF